MENPYIPELARITDIRDESPKVRTFTIALRNERPFPYKPGQFVELSVFGTGEFPVSISGILAPARGGFRVSVRQSGAVTTNMMKLPVGATVGIRGPFGNGFPLDALAGRDVLLIAGGVGISPLKYLAECLLEQRDRYGKITLLYGSVSPSEVLFRDVLESWGGEEGRRNGLETVLTVDAPSDGWEGNVGVVTELLGKVEVSPEKTNAVICGPSVMMRFTTERLIAMGFPGDHLFLSFERRMQCGMGMCGHCMIGEKRVCLDGPVFEYEAVKGVFDRLF